MGSWADMLCLSGSYRILMDSHMQDAIKKGSNSELPDFYNIVLERPKDDPAGYDVLFVDAASKVGPACVPRADFVMCSAPPAV